MNERWLRSFVMVAQNGSVTKTAEQMFFSPQALLQQINLLEKDTGIRLFHRSKSGVALTPEGERYYEGVKKILSDYDALLVECRRGTPPSKKLRIPVNTDVIAPAFLETVCGEYRQCAGALPTELVSTPTVIYPWLDGLLSHTFDVIECYTIDGYAPENVYYEKYFDVSNWCMVRKDHPLAQKTAVAPRDLGGFQLVNMCVGLIEYLNLYLKHTAVQAMFEEIPSQRCKLIDCCESGKVCLVSKPVAYSMPEYACIPLAFDCHVQSGLACRKEDAEDYWAFFATAAGVAARMPKLYC